MLRIAHRGASALAPENTLAAVRRAIELGATWVEVDVQACADGLVVIHDDTLERTTDGHGPVATQTVAALRALDAGHGERIPLPQEVLDLCRGRCALNLELKGPRVAPRLLPLLRDALLAGWSADALLCSSFDWPQLAALHAALPDLPLLLPAELEQVVHTWNATTREYPRDSSLPELFARVAQELPDGPAVIGSGEVWSYRRLAAASDRLARRLRALGVGPETPVGLAIERSPALVLGTLAIVKAGGAYVPLDAGHPDERLAFLLADTGARIVLVHGATGGVGMAAVQLARHMGALVTGVCSTPKVEMVRSIGADHVIDYTREDFANGSRRWDVILDIGGSLPLSRLRRALTPRGTLVLVGGEGGGRWLGVVARLLRARLLSPFVGQNLRTFLSSENHEDMLVLAELAASGKLAPAIDRTYPLAVAPDAMRYLEEGHVRGKVAITVQTDP